MSESKGITSVLSVVAIASTLGWRVESPLPSLPAAPSPPLYLCLSLPLPSLPPPPLSPSALSPAPSCPGPPTARA